MSLKMIYRKVKTGKKGQKLLKKSRIAIFASSMIKATVMKQILFFLFLFSGLGVCEAQSKYNDWAVGDVTGCVREIMEDNCGDDDIPKSTMIFHADGELYYYNGSILRKGDLKRDKHKRVKKIVEYYIGEHSDVEVMTTEFTYDEQGRVATERWETSYDGCTLTYTRDENGRIVSMKKDMGVGYTVFTFTYIEFDEHNNWIRRHYVERLENGNIFEEGDECRYLYYFGEDDGTAQ